MNKAPVRKLKRLLESRLYTITKFDAAKSDGVFSQNRGFLLLQGRAARNDLRALPALRAGQEGLPAVYSTIYAMTENGKIPSVEQLADAVRHFHKVRVRVFVNVFQHAVERQFDGGPLHFMGFLRHSKNSPFTDQNKSFKRGKILKL